MSKLIEKFIKFANNTADSYIISSSVFYAFKRGERAIYERAECDLDHVLQNLEIFDLTLVGYMALYLKTQEGISFRGPYAPFEILELYGLNSRQSCLLLWESVDRDTKFNNYFNVIRKCDLTSIFENVLGCKLRTKTKAKPKAIGRPKTAEDVIAKGGLPCEAHNPDPISDFDLIMREIQRSCKG